MVKIRLRRTGAKKKPNYRVVITDSRSPRDGRFIEIVGHYDPRTEPVTFKIHEDRVLHWLSEGAQPTDPVRRLLGNAGTLDRFARLKAGEDLDKLLAEAQATREKNQQIVEAVAEEEKPQAQTEVQDEVEVAGEAEVPEEVVADPEEDTTVEAEVSEEVVADPEEDTTAEAEVSEEVVADPEEDTAAEADENE